MAIQISHLDDVIKVDDEIKLVAKTEDNYDDFVAIATQNKEHLAAWLPWAKTIPDEGSFIHYTEATKRKENNEAADWSIYFNDKLAGAIGLMNRDRDANVLEIGYWLTKDNVGKGIMRRSVSFLIDVAFNQTDTPKIEIAADKANKASIKVALSCGLELESSKEKEPEAYLESGIHQTYAIWRSK